jgi:branched-chain amino acid transport system ATP-binding protein
VTLLSVKSLYAGYGQGDVLHGIDVEVAPGGVTAVLGSNGAGKTTLLRAITGMVEHRGEVSLEGRRIDRTSTEDIARLGVAHVPEGRGTFVQLTTEENLRLGAYSRRDRAAVAADFERVYRYFPRLAERRAQQAGTLSGGEQQMLALGRALMLRPKLIVMDEPSFGLAPLVVEEIYRILRDVSAAERMGILLVEQNAVLALQFADRACVLETGRVVMAGAAADVRADESIRRAYLGL